MATPLETSVVIPAYNEGAVIGDVVRALFAAGSWHQVIVVDDGLADDTASAAAAAGADVVRHPYNKGNGASVKTGIRRATADYVLILDGDGQHPPEDAIRIAARLGDFDLVVGARASATQATGARRLGNRALNALAGYLTERPIPDLTSGFRGARRLYLREFLHLLPNGFSTPTTTTLAFIKAGYNVTFEPIDARQRVGTSKINFTRDGVKFFLIVLRVITIFSPLRIFLPVSIGCFLVGFAYMVWTIITQSHITNSSVLLIVLAVVIFLVGLVSEQISALRFEGRE